MENISEILSGSLVEPTVWAVVFAYGGGLLVSFTPCVYPVIPVTVAIVGMRGAGGKGGGFIHGLCYLLGMALSYTLMGMIAALTGKVFGQWQANPWFYFLLANFFIFLGLASLGVFRLSLTLLPGINPEAVGRKGPGGTVLLGALSSLVLGPCTAPVLAVILGYVALGQNLLYGAALLFSFSLGLGTLLLLLGASTALILRLPRAGAWLGFVNKVFGLLFLGVGEYLLIQMGMRL